jgi:hypothetical protein
MALTSTEKIDALNIGLMLFSCCVAIVLPFELFLIVYAILGPLHYLTEISWLHDKKYFSKAKYDPYILLAIGLLLTAFQFKDKIEQTFQIYLPDDLRDINARLVYVALLGSIIFITVKNNFYRIAGLALLILTSSLSQHMFIFLTVFIPTLIHVYIFTGLFMLFGALKSKSRLGILSVIMLLLCPFILYNVYPNTYFFHIRDTSKNIYDAFFKMVNVQTLLHVFGYSKPIVTDPKVNPLSLWDNIVYNTRDGVMLMRFIAFAYTYHYLNWFSKTKVIQWHKVPKMRFVGVIILWLISIGIYAYNYTAGLQWLFFLSFLHVLLEFPLNFTSIIGIGKHFMNKLKPAAAT